MPRASKEERRARNVKFMVKARAALAPAVQVSPTPKAIVGQQKDGKVLRPSKKNPRVMRWQGLDEDPAIPHHVQYEHPKTKARHTGSVRAAGHQGITVESHATGEIHKVEHGRYEPREKEKPRDWRKEMPNLSKYPNKDITDVTEGKPGQNFALKWRVPKPGGGHKDQYAYTLEQIAARAEEKFKKILSFGGKLPSFEQAVAEDLQTGGTSETAVMAAMATIVNRTLIRAGGSTEETHGVSTLQKRHVTINGNEVRFDYLGKDKVPQTKIIRDKHVADLVRHLMAKKTPRDLLFCFPDGRKMKPVTAATLRKYISGHSGGGTTKDFRTFHATRLFAEAANELGPPPNREAAEAMIKQAALVPAEALGHKKRQTRKHFAQAPVGKRRTKQVEKHGGRLYPGGRVGFLTSKERKEYLAAVEGTTKIPKDQNPEVDAEWLPEVMTSLNNYIDPKVVEAYRQGLALSYGGRMEKADSEERPYRQFMDYLRRVDEFDPYGRLRRQRDEQDHQAG